MEPCCDQLPSEGQGSEEQRGVTDLAALTQEIHRFESGYLESLVGPWPAATQRYRERSPLHRVRDGQGPVVVFQGLKDRVVLPEQTERMAAALLGVGRQGPEEAVVPAGGGEGLSPTSRGPHGSLCSGGLIQNGGLISWRGEYLPPEP